MPKKEIPEDEGPSQEWLASYADAMTLLLAFFIMMFAFALVDEGKFFDFKVGVVAALGIPDPLTDNTDSILSEGTGVTPEVGFTPLPPTEESEEEAEDIKQALAALGEVTAENAEDIRDLLQYEFDRLGATDYVEVGVDERGVFIRFDGRVLFPSGSADLDDNGLALLATAASVLGVVDNLLEIEGHTDSQPTSGIYPSNWELSAIRASSVVRWLIEFGQIPDPQLLAVGRADTKPRADNATAEGRAENRRVEIIIRVAGIAESGVDVINPLGSDPAGLDEFTDDDPAQTDGAADGVAADGETEGTADGEPIDGEPIDGEPIDGGPIDPGVGDDGTITPIDESEIIAPGIVNE